MLTIVGEVQGSCIPKPSYLSVRLGNKNRLYIHVGSMGRVGTFGILSNFSEKFAAAYVVCGGAKVISQGIFIMKL